MKSKEDSIEKGLFFSDKIFWKEDVPLFQKIAPNEWAFFLTKGPNAQEIRFLPYVTSQPRAE